MLLALKSSLPNEVDWAFNSLVRLSYQYYDTFPIDHIPGLLDVLIKFAEPFFERHVYPTINEHNNQQYRGSPQDRSIEHIDRIFFNSLEFQESLERTLQVFHILRNISFYEH